MFTHRTIQQPPLKRRELNDKSSSDVLTNLYMQWSGQLHDAVAKIDFTTTTQVLIEIYQYCEKCSIQCQKILTSSLRDDITAINTAKTGNQENYFHWLFTQQNTLEYEKQIGTSIGVFISYFFTQSEIASSLQFENVNYLTPAELANHQQSSSEEQYLKFYTLLSVYNVFLSKQPPGQRSLIYNNYGLELLVIADIFHFVSTWTSANDPKPLRTILDRIIFDELRGFNPEATQNFLDSLYFFRNIPENTSQKLIAEKFASLWRCKVLSPETNLKTLFQVIKKIFLFLSSKNSNILYFLFTAAPEAATDLLANPKFLVSFRALLANKLEYLLTEKNSEEPLLYSAICRNPGYAFNFIACIKMLAESLPWRTLALRSITTPMEEYSRYWQRPPEFSAESDNLMSPYYMHGELLCDYTPLEISCDPNNKDGVGISAPQENVRCLNDCLPKVSLYFRGGLRTPDSDIQVVINSLPSRITHLHLQGCDSIKACFIAMLHLPKNWRINYLYISGHVSCISYDEDLCQKLITGLSKLPSSIKTLQYGAEFPYYVGLSPAFGEQSYTKTQKKYGIESFFTAIARSSIEHLVLGIATYFLYNVSQNELKLIFAALSSGKTTSLKTCCIVSHVDNDGFIVNDGFVGMQQQKMWEDKRGENVDSTLGEMFAKFSSSSGIKFTFLPHCSMIRNAYEQTYNELCHNTEKNKEQATSSVSALYH